MRQHGAGALAGHAADFGFLDEMGALMVWGTLILFADCIMMILLYERLRAAGRQPSLLRLALTGALVCRSIRRVLLRPAPPHRRAALGAVRRLGREMAAVAIYAGLGAVYLRQVEVPRRRDKKAPRMRDVFDLLTYRERYEDLMARSAAMRSTGALDRGRLEHLGRKRVEEAALAGRPISLLILDIDHFKSFNDRFGHAAGESCCCASRASSWASVGIEDAVFRYGGEEFVVIGPDLTRAAALALGERIRRDVASHMDADAGAPLVTVSIGPPPAPTTPPNTTACSNAPTGGSISPNPREELRDRRNRRRSGAPETRLGGCTRPSFLRAILPPCVVLPEQVDQSATKRSEAEAPRMRRPSGAPWRAPQGDD